MRKQTVTLYGDEEFRGSEWYECRNEDTNRLGLDFCASDLLSHLKIKGNPDALKVTISTRKRDDALAVTFRLRSEESVYVDIGDVSHYLLRHCSVTLEEMLGDEMFTKTFYVSGVVA